MRAAFAVRFSSPMVRSTARPAAAHTGLPAAVMMAKAGWKFISSAGPTTAEIGRPPPRPLP